MGCRVRVSEHLTCPPYHSVVPPSLSPRALISLSSRCLSVFLNNNCKNGRSHYCHNFYRCRRGSFETAHSVANWQCRTTESQESRASPIRWRGSRSRMASYIAIVTAWLTLLNRTTGESAYGDRQCVIVRVLGAFVPPNWSNLSIRGSTSLRSSIINGLIKNGRKYQVLRDNNVNIPSDERQFDSMEVRARESNAAIGR